MTSLKGNLNSVDLANVFQMLSMNQREGTLYIFDGRSRKAIYFGQEGVSILTRGRHRPNAIGRILIRHDKITPEQLQEALRGQRDGEGRMLGHVLVEQGHLTRADVEDALRLQIEEEVYSLFIWKDAQFEFVEGAPEAGFASLDGVNRLTFSVNSLIMEASKRVDEWEWIQRVVPASEEVYRYTGANVELADDVFERPWAGKVLASIDGKRTLLEIEQVSYVNRFEVHKIVALLVEGGAVSPLTVDQHRGEADAAAAAGDHEGTVKYLSRIAARGVASPEVHRRLGESFEAKKQLVRAVHHYREHAESLAAAGKRHEAFDAYRRICGLLPTDLGAADRMLELFAGNPEGLESHAAEMVARGKALADVYVDLRRQSRAIQVLHRVVSLGQDDADLRNRLIGAYLQTGMIGEAIAEYDALAETALAMRDFEQAERIYRKILSIDRTRDDAQAKLNHVLSRKKLRTKGLRTAVIAAVVIGAVGWGAFLGWEWWTSWQQSREASESAFAARLAELNARHLPLHAELDAVQRTLAVAYGEPESLRAALRDGAAARGALAEKANRAARDFHGLGEEFPSAREVETARAAAEGLEKKVAAVAEQESRLGAALEQRVDAMWDEIDLRWTELGTRQLRDLLDRVLGLAEAAPQWASGPAGRKAQELHANLQDTLRKFEQANVEVASLVAANDHAGAQARALKLLEEVRPPQDLYGEIPMFRSVVTRPAGARILLDDRDTGMVTPAMLDVRCHAPAKIQLVLAGYEPADVAVPSLRVVDPRTLRADVGLTIDTTMRKELVFRTQAASARISASPAVVGDRLVVPTKGRTTDLFDLRGTPKGSLAVGTLAQPAAHGDTAVLLGADRFAHFVRGPETELVGRRPLPGTPTCDPLSFQDLAIVADQDGHLIALEIPTLVEAWRYPEKERLQAGFAGTPLLVGGDLVAVSVDGNVVVVDALTGRVRSERAVRDGGLAKIRFHTGAALAGTSVIAVAREESQGRRSRLVALDPSTGEVRWTRTIEGAVRWTPLVWQDVVYAATEEGKVVGFRIATGTPEPGPVHDLGARISAEPALLDGVIYVGDAGGTVSALDVRGSSIELLWTFKIPAHDPRLPVVAVTRPTFSADLVLFGADDRSVYALRR